MARQAFVLHKVFIKVNPVEQGNMSSCLLASSPTRSHTSQHPLALFTFDTNTASHNHKIKSPSTWTEREPSIISRSQGSDGQESAEALSGLCLKAHLVRVRVNKLLRGPEYVF